MTKIQLGKNITRHYNEHNHGKSQMDGNEGTVKNPVFKRVKYSHCIIDSPLQFAQYTNEICESITSLYMSVDDKLEEPEVEFECRPLPHPIVR